MSLTMFLAILVVASDFMLYMFFRWTFGEKYRARARRTAARRRAIEGNSPRPCLLSSPTEHRGRDTVREVA